MTIPLWAGCSAPRADDYIDLGDVDPSKLDAHGLLAVVRALGIAPGADTINEEVLRKQIQRHAMSA